jgi:hypothetical protein
MLVQEAEEGAPTECESFISKLRDPSQEELRGDLARLLLGKLAESSELVPSLKQALDRATEPQMVLTPETFALAVLVLGSLNISGRLGPLRLEYKPRPFIESLTKFVKALPPGILSKIVHGGRK